MDHKPSELFDSLDLTISQKRNAGIFRATIAARNERAQEQRAKLQEKFKSEQALEGDRRRSQAAGDLPQRRLQLPSKKERKSTSSLRGPNKRRKVSQLTHSTPQPSSHKLAVA